MSDFYYNLIDSQNQLNRLPNSVLTTKGDKKSWMPRGATPWSPELSILMVKFFTDLDYPYRNYEEIPFAEPLRSEIRRFLISLDAYIESSNPVIPEKNILFGSTDKNYAKFLKRVRRKSFETTWNVEHFAYPDWWNDVPSYPIKDIGDIFNYSYVPFFLEEEENIDDYKFGLIPVKINSAYLDEFRSQVRELLPSRSKFDKIERNEVLLKISSSMSYSGPKIRKKDLHYRLKPDALRFSKRRTEALRSIIHVCPENTRDSVIVPVEDLNTISLIDLQVIEILRSVEGHIHLRDKNEVNKRYHHLNKTYSYFIHRDLKKEGITKPRALLKVMLEELHAAYPDIEIFENTEFYDDFTILKDGEVVDTYRGHGLGMANSLTTLMQLAIDGMVKDKMLDNIGEVESEPLVLNDDNVVGFNSIYHAEEYWDIEEEVLDGLSLIREPTKSFISTYSFVLAERYFFHRAEYKKESYQRRELMLPLACYNIVHAKSYFCSAQLYCHTEYRDKYLERVASYWGYEFFPTESNYPSLVGGWVNEKIEGVDLALLYLDELPYKSYVSRGFFAQQERVSCKKNKGKLYNSPSVQLFYGYTFPEEYNNVMNNLPLSSINEKYGKKLSMNQKYFREYWDQLSDKRRATFKKDNQLTYEELLIEIVRTRQTTQFYPSSSMIDHYEEYEVCNARIYDFYLDPNPLLAMLKLYNDSFSYDFAEEFSISFSDTDSFKLENELFSREIQRTLKNDQISALFTNSENVYIVPKNTDYDPCQQYLNPFKIGVVANKKDWGKGYPVLREEYVSPILLKKTQVYGRIFNIRESQLICKYRFSRLCIKSLAKDDNIPETIRFLLDNVSIENSIQTLPEEDAYDSDEEESEAIRKMTDDPYSPWTGDPQLISVRRAERDFMTIFFIWRLNKDAFFFETSDLNKCFSYYDIALMYGQLGLPGTETRKAEFEVEIAESNQFVRLFCQKFNILSGFEPIDIFNRDTESDDDPGGLFDGFF